MTAMRRVVVLLLLAILVNFPWGHELWVARQLDAHGRDVNVRIVGQEVVEGRFFVRYRVPGSKDVYSARVRQESYDIARKGGALPGRVVPGSPGENQVDGQIRGHGFMTTALVADAFLLVAALALWMRRRRSGYDVRAVDDDLITIDARGDVLTTRALPEVLARLRPGRPTHARLSLAAHTDLLPGDGPEGLTATDEPATYRLCGRVVDVGPGWLEVAAGELTVRVRVGQLRARADLRESAEVTGELWLT